MTDFHSFTVTLSRKFTRKTSLQTPLHLNSIATLPCEILMSDNIACPICWGTVFQNTNSHDIWQAATVVTEASHNNNSINLGSHINEHHTGVAWFQHAVSHRCSVQRQPFALMSLFFVAPDAYSRSFSEFFSVANVNSFLSLKQIKITSFGNSFEQKGLAWRFDSISCPCPEGVSLNTSNHGRGDKMICRTPDRAI